MNPIVPLGLLAAGAALLFGKKAGASAGPAPKPVTLPATPAQPSAPSQTVSVNGHVWKLVRVAAAAVTTDVFAPAGSWGPHGELRVLRFTQASANAPRVLAGVAEGVPKNVLDAAMKDLGVVTPQGPAAVPTPSGIAPMPASLQSEIAAAMMGLGVNAAGQVVGPVTAESIRVATELSSRLDQMGYKEAAAQLRAYAQAAGKLLPTPTVSTPAAPLPAAPIPGVPPELMAAVQRALLLERDPAKLSALRTALSVLPPSPERNAAMATLDALILQVRSAQAVSTAATEVEQVLSQSPVATPTPSGPRLLKLTKPNMSGPDVLAWQKVLQASGYSLGPDGADGFFGPTTDRLTRDWQKKHGLTGDGVVGPDTLSKIGTPPTATSTPVPATASPRPDPAPKSALAVTAESVATHLLALQQKHGVKGSKGKQDLQLVKRFQAATGSSSPDGLPGTGTILALARAGIGVLPAVMYWNKTATRARDLPLFRSELQKIAAAARAGGNPVLASAIEASASRETGQGGLA